ncbi:MAG TPA: hypothetical protein VMR86_05830 [Myxococcota bacterium]|nr:hypothetical protein [Myxococcota bacterium]
MQRMLALLVALAVGLLGVTAQAAGPFLKESALCHIFDSGLGFGQDTFGSLQLDTKGNFTGKLQMITPYHKKARFPTTLFCWVECNRDQYGGLPCGPSELKEGQKFSVKARGMRDSLPASCDSPVLKVLGAAGAFEVTCEGNLAGP